MASSPKLFFSCIFLILFSCFYHLSSSAEVPSPSNPAASITNICKSTPYPSFCRSVLPKDNSTANVYDYGRFSVKRSLSAARKFLSMIEKYLRNSKYLTKTAVGALKDCQFLAALNMDFLKTSFQSVNGTSKALPTLEAEDVQTMLSAILTNTQTCLDGLQATSSTWSVRNGLTAPLTNDTKIFSLSLALFTRGWVPKKKKLPPHPTKRRFPFADVAGMPMKMSQQTRKLYETVSRRKLFESDDDYDGQVLINDIVIVSQDGTANFTNINDAVAAAPNKTDATDGYFLIYVTAGLYEEYVSIAKNKRYLMMIGDGINQTIITGNHSFVDGWTTFNSSTFAVVGQGFVAVNMTFRNTAGAIKHQAVAVRNGADLSTFYSCSFEGYQDTLYTHSLRQFYRDCDIYGTVDFVFGNAAVVFQNCNFYPRRPLDNQFNAITAQGRSDPNQNTGISIQKCHIRAADDLATSNVTIRTYLGRPWKEYSRTIFMETYMDSLIHPTGWTAWNGDFALNTSYYAEYNNTGPGSNVTGRVIWPAIQTINVTDIANFNVDRFLLGDDWLPQTGVPYNSVLY